MLNEGYTEPVPIRIEIGHFGSFRGEVFDAMVVLRYHSRGPRSFAAGDRAIRFVDAVGCRSLTVGDGGFVQ